MRFFSTEQVSKWHPDKYADQISDAILTAYLRQDKHAHVAVETMVKGETVVLGGEITSTANVSHKEIIQRVADKLGYKVTEIIDLIGRQSPEINGAVGEAEGAGDQGMMFGFATDQTTSHLPLGFEIANSVIKAIEEDIETNPETILKGDAKCQVTMEDETYLRNILVSVCHKEGYAIEAVRNYVKHLIVDKMFPFYDDEQTLDVFSILQVHPAGTWTIGGPAADCGLTGRKIVCDQYGGYCAVGGGAFSGKDPSKVDRSAAYMARKIAVDMVKKYGGDCEVQIAYAIGVAQPVSVSAQSTRAGDLSDEVEKTYDLTPKGIIKALDLYNKDYEKIAEGCHFREGLWE